jgi:hypothetical protein
MVDGIELILVEVVATLWSLERGHAIKVVLEG